MQGRRSAFMLREKVSGPRRGRAAPRRGRAMISCAVTVLFVICEAVAYRRD